MGKGNSINVRGMGSIEKLDRYRWRVRVPLGKDPVTGKYLRSPSITVHGTKTDAINALQEYRWQLSSGEAPARKGLIPTVGEHAQQFHDQREGTLGSPLTYKREGQTICRIKQYFGDYDLVDLTPAVLRATYTQLRKRGATPERTAQAPSEALPDNEAGGLRARGARRRSRCGGRGGRCGNIACLCGERALRMRRWRRLRWMRCRWSRRRSMRPAWLRS